VSLFLIVPGTVFFLYGAVLCFFSNITTGTVLTVLFGLLVALCGVFFGKIRLFSKKKIGKITISSFCLLCAFEICLCAFIALYGQADNVSYDEDVVIVLGAGLRGDRVSDPLRRRLDAAIEYHEKNPDALIVVTGGRGIGEDVTEAYAMEKYLIDRGVSQERIIKEERSTSTNENMRFSKKILDEILPDGYTIAVITNNFHIFRGVSIAKIEGFENVTHLHASLAWYNAFPCYVRESLAVMKMWVFG